MDGTNKRKKKLNILSNNKEKEENRKENHKIL